MSDRRLLPAGKRRAIWPAVLTVAAILVAATGASADDMVRRVEYYHPTFFAEFQDVQVANGYVYLFGVGGLAVVDPVSDFVIGRWAAPGPVGVRLFRGLDQPTDIVPIIRRVYTD